MWENLTVRNNEWGLYCSMLNILLQSFVFICMIMPKQFYYISQEDRFA